MGRHRSRLTILARVLSVVSDNHGAKKTQIMYQAYLSYKLLSRYLKDVMDAGLVICGDDDCYRLTSKGKTFLAKFKNYSSFRENVDEQVNHVEDQKMMLEEMCPNNSEVANVAQRPVERDKA